MKRFLLCLLFLTATLRAFDVSPPPKQGEDIAEETAFGQTFQNKSSAAASPSSNWQNELRKHSAALHKREAKGSVAAMKRLVKSLPRESRNQCSLGVRNLVLAETGVDIFSFAKTNDVGKTHEGHLATSVGSMERLLERAGYVPIPSESYIPQLGDVQNISFLHGKKMEGYGGHTQYYDGEKWVSDYVQVMSAAHPASLKAQGLSVHNVIVTTYRKK